MRSKKRFIAVIAVVGAVSGVFPAWAGGKGAMEIGLSAHYSVSGLDASEFSPNYDYGLIYHYWLNDTTTLFAAFTQMSYVVPIEVNGRDDDFLFNTGILFGGFRWRPEVDFFLKPYVEAGVGYQTWSTTEVPDMLKTREGGSVGYFAGGGLEYEILHPFTVGLNCRYFYLVMQEEIETKAVLQPTGRWAVREESFENVGFASAGVELTWRFR